MANLYEIIHAYDVDGGFGDAVKNNKTLFVTPNKVLAEAFVAKWSDERVYDTPYDELRAGKLIIRELPLLTEEDLRTGPLCWPWFDGRRCSVEEHIAEVEEDQRLADLEDSADEAEEAEEEREEHYRQLLGNQWDHLF